MKKVILTLFIISFSVLAFLVINKNRNVGGDVLGYGAPAYIGEDPSTDINVPGYNRLSDLINWKRPIGPLKVGLQVGHWKNKELPDELEKIRGNSGAASSGVSEWEVNLAIAKATKELLEKEGVTVDILPAAVPVSYWADAFVAIHADGSESGQKNGFKVAAPWRDFSGKAYDLERIIDSVYAQEVGFPRDPNITRNMRGYYAFSWWRFDHAVHPKTPAVILETGFLTNPDEAKTLINTPEVPAKALADALLRFLDNI